MSASYFYIVSDSFGAVGAFPTEAEAQKCISTYPKSPMIKYRFAYSGGSSANIYFVLYRDINAVAFASDSREAAMLVHSELVKVGLTYDDINAVDFWTCSNGTMIEAAKRRLEETHSSADQIDSLEDSNKKMLTAFDKLTSVMSDGFDITHHPAPPSITDCIVTYHKSADASESSESASSESESASSESASSESAFKSLTAAGPSSSDDSSSASSNNAGSIAATKIEAASFKLS